VLILVLTLSAPLLAQAPDGPEPPRLAELAVGFGGRCKVGCWTPARVTIEGGASAIDGFVTITLPDGDDVPCRFHSERVRVPPGQRVSVGLLVRFGRTYSDMSVALHEDGREQPWFDESITMIDEDDTSAATQATDDENLPTVAPPLDADRLLWVTLGAPLGLEEAAKGLSKQARAKVVVKHLSGAEGVAALPTSWLGYEGVDVVAVATGGTGDDALASLEGNERLEALDRWVHLGGRLVLLAGAAAPEVLAAGEAGHPLARFAPGEYAGQATLSRLSVLEEYTGGAHPLEGKAELSVPRLTGVDPRQIEAHDGDLPLVVRTPRGLGEVVFVALDAHERPLVDWDGRGALLARLVALDSAAINAGERRGERNSSEMAGFSDISGQLRAALDQHGRRRVPFALVATLVVVYILLIGPGDYLLISKVLRRRQMAWVSFPVIVLAFSGGAYFAGRWLKGSTLRVNQIDLVDVDVATGNVRTTCWFNLLSPETLPYDLAVQSVPPEGDEAGEPQALSWLGLPGTGLGGMSSATAAGEGFGRAYDTPADLLRLPNVPIRVWDSKSFVARGAGETTLDLQARLSEGATEEVVGSLTNELPVPLEDCLLAHGRWVYRLGTLAPGESRTIEALTERRELATHLTQRRLDRDAGSRAYVQQATPYDTFSTDPLTILQTMMFFEAAGGQQYTTLTHRFQGFVDLSGRLRRGRAILVGWSLRPGAPAGQAGATILHEGRPLDDEASASAAHWTCYRWLLPVAGRQVGP
jgi:hypothetical protein